jgi:hypothetical protein
MLRKTFFFMVLGFELRASDFLSKPSSIWATLVALYALFVWRQ